MNESAPPPAPRTSLRELAALFARLGATSFGGPAVHIAMMRDEVVVRRRWLSEARFLDLVGATALIPGPSSTELAIHIGWERRRWPGLFVAGLAFIVPAMLITGACAWAYVRFGALPQAGGLLYGVKPVILGIVAQALVGLAPGAARNIPLRGIGMLAFVLALVGVSELALLVGGGLCAWLVARIPVARGGPAGWQQLAPVGPLVVLAGGSVSPPALPAIFGVFAKIGAVLFGSGYVLVAFLRAEFVARLGWIGDAQLLDAVAVGQITPGPVFTTATFLGYLLAGVPGALAATAGIFAPAFVYVALSGPLVPRLRASRDASAFLDGVNVASLALMAAVLVQLARSAFVDVPTLLLGVGATWALVSGRARPTWLLGLGALAGVVLEALDVAR